MQAILQRSARANRAAQRKFEETKKARDLYDKNQRVKTRLDHLGSRRAADRKNLRRSQEDWRLGPLAPRRDYGPRNVSWGTVPREDIIPRSVGPALAPEDKLSYDRHTLRTFYRPEDRVVILRGPERGVIGKVQSVDEETMTLKLSDLSKKYITFSKNDAKWIGQTEAPPEGQLQPMYLRQADVRLVMTTPEGKDVIVDKMLVTKERHISGTDIIRRYIPGTMHDIDAGLDLTPAMEEIDENAPVHYEAMDTFSHDLYRVTWAPSLDQPPFPATIIDELRNKFSKTRTRHDDEFVQKMLAIDEKRDLKTKAGKLMLRTPSKEYGIQQRAAASELARQQKLSAESMALLSEHMAKHFQLTKGKKSMRGDSMLSAGMPAAAGNFGGST